MVVSLVLYILGGWMLFTILSDDTDGIDIPIGITWALVILWPFFVVLYILWPLFSKRPN